MKLLHLVSFGTALAARDMSLKLLSPTRCLDGSPAGYYFDAAPSGEKSSWVIFMEGGGACGTEADCKARAKTDLGSSKNWARSGDLPDNVLSSDCSVNPLWCNSNRVFVPYCTGDVHLGGRTAPTNETWGLYFSGRPNFATILQDLKSSHGLNEATSTLLSGCSAGAIGAFHSVDFLAGEIPNSIVRGAPQAGWFFPNVTFFDAWKQGKFLPPYNPKISTLWGSSHSLSAECQAKHGVDSFYCFSLNTAYQYIKSDVHIGENAADSQQVYGELFAPKDPKDPAVKKQVFEFIEYYQGTMLASIQQVQPAIAGGKKDALWMPSCFDHCGDIDLVHDQLKVQGYTYKDSLISWWNKDGQVPAFLVAECTKDKRFPCSQSCDHYAPNATAPDTRDPAPADVQFTILSDPEAVSEPVEARHSAKEDAGAGVARDDGERLPDGTVGDQCDTWYDSQKHGPSWRNVKDYGAKGDGSTDDTKALHAALTEGRSPKFTTLNHATVYFPPGTYIISEQL